MLARRIQWCPGWHNAENELVRDEQLMLNVVLGRAPLDLEDRNARRGADARANIDSPLFSGHFHDLTVGCQVCSRVVVSHVIQQPVQLDRHIVVAWVDDDAPTDAP